MSIAPGPTPSVEHDHYGKRAAHSLGYDEVSSEFAVFHLGVEEGSGFEVLGFLFGGASISAVLN